MFVNAYIRNHCTLICWPLPNFLLLAVQDCPLSHTTDNASCFDASRLSINTSTTDSYSSVQKVGAYFWEFTELPNTLYRLYVKKVGVLAVGGGKLALAVMLMFAER